MEIFFDTHVFLWWILEDDRISDRAAQLISNGRNRLYWSAASSWEVTIKYSLGKLNLPEKPEKFFPAQFLQNQIYSLPVNDTHAFKVGTLPMHHKDPFDRLLIAQSMVENITLLSDDQYLHLYDVNIIQ
ncbi:type II toxin-antitoxin system VapC family toxin [Desulfobacterales bacterium HSG17]|nr:type II toxin-antitoxin system VapC family toxin [Desulfobacterales bacterium HSG17]